MLVSNINKDNRDWFADGWRHSCMPACLPACMPARLPACLPACPPARLPACLPACLPAWPVSWLAGCLPVPVWHRHRHRRLGSAQSRDGERQTLASQPQL